VDICSSFVEKRANILTQRARRFLGGSREFLPFRHTGELQGRSFISVLEDQSGSYRVDGRAKQKYSRERDGEIERDGKGKYETRLGLFSVPHFCPSFFPRSSVSVICRLLFDSTPLVLTRRHGYSHRLNDSLIGL